MISCRDIGWRMTAVSWSSSSEISFLSVGDTFRPL
jgi:hypothetical protein